MKNLGTLASLQVGMPQEYPLKVHTEAKTNSRSSWRTGFVKQPVADRKFVSMLQIEGDGQADTVHHGGKDKAVLVYAAGHYPNWTHELAHEPAHQGKSLLGNGAFGENFTVTQWSEETACIGDVLSVGTAVVEVSQPRVPCWKISERWGIPDLLTRVQRTGRTGWYLRVLQEGFVQAGDTLGLMNRPNPDFTVQLVNDIIHKRLSDVSVMREVEVLPELADACRNTVQRRIAALHGA